MAMKRWKSKIIHLLQLNTKELIRWALVMKDISKWAFTYWILAGDMTLGKSALRMERTQMTWLLLTIGTFKQLTTMKNFYLITIVKLKAATIEVSVQKASWTQRKELTISWHVVQNVLVDNMLMEIVTVPAKNSLISANCQRRVMDSSSSSTHNK